MRCGRCHHNEATVYIEQVIGTEMKKIHLCNECAFSSDMNFGLPFMSSPIISSQSDQVFKHAHNFWFAPEGQKKERIACEVCGYSFERFKKSSMLGCASCYEAFKSELIEVFAKLQSGARHAGKVPKLVSEALQKDSHIADLKEALKNAIISEEYEEAAKIRDTLRAITGGK